MSLKVFHVFFVLVVISLGVFCAWWSFTNQVPPVIGYCSLGLILAMVIYGLWFLRKARHIIT